MLCVALRRMHISPVHSNSVINYAYFEQCLRDRHRLKNFSRYNNFLILETFFFQSLLKCMGPFFIIFEQIKKGINSHFNKKNQKKNQFFKKLFCCCKE